MPDICPGNILLSIGYKGYICNLRFAVPSRIGARSLIRVAFVNFSEVSGRFAWPVFSRRKNVVSSAKLKLAALAIAIGFAAVGVAFGQMRPSGGPTPSPAGAAVFFVDLQDGATVPTRFTIRFGLRGMELARAGVDRPNTGHHHLLIDTELPPMNDPIPNDFNHLHFGDAQAEAEITLPPGEHTLQLLLGDKDHIPHSPPLMSQKIKVRVSEGAAPPAAAALAPSPPAGGMAAPSSGSSRRHASPAGARVYFIYPSDGARISPTSTIRFGLSNMGVAPAGVEKANTGHHHLLIDSPLPPMDEPIPLDFNHLHFGAGQTEAEVTLPLGTHTLQLLLGDENHVPHDPPVYSQPIKVVVMTEKGERSERSESSEDVSPRRAVARSHPRPRPGPRARPQSSGPRFQPDEY
jgi:hypothetical protein